MFVVLQDQLQRALSVPELMDDRIKPVKTAEVGQIEVVGIATADEGLIRSAS